ncbi:MAG: sodium:calcium antiporter, partial [Bacteroidales bacterium]|nr:sodium:calcium antiporter [Bacteroidales bacterium]
MILYLLLVVVGFACLIYGANWLVDGASALAKKYKMSDLAIGLTIVAFGTSAPELVVNVVASVNGYSDLILGNIIGSNNFNTFIILGLSGIIMPIVVQSSTARKEIPISLFITVLLLFFLNDFNFSEPGSLSRWEAIVLLLLFLLFMYYVFNQMKRDSTLHTDVVVKSNVKIWGLILVGLSGLIIGGQLV